MNFNSRRKVTFSGQSDFLTRVLINNTRSQEIYKLEIHNNSKIVMRNKMVTFIFLSIFLFNDDRVNCISELRHD